MNLTAAAEVLREFETDPEFDALDPRVRMAISRLLKFHKPSKAPKPIATLRSPEDAAWSTAIKRGVTACAVCQKPTDPTCLEAMHCAPRANRSLRPGFDRHSVLGNCCLSHDRANGAPGCHECHRALHNNAAANEAFWRTFFGTQGQPADHFERLFEEANHSHKMLPRRDVSA